MNRPSEKKVRYACPYVINWSKLLGEYQNIPLVSLLRVIWSALIRVAKCIIWTIFSRLARIFQYQQPPDRANKKSSQLAGHSV
jgi:hypothetical protein